MQASIFVAAVISLGLLGAFSAMKLHAQSAPQPSANQPVTFNPLRATHDVEVGKFYMDRGDFDGAITRFKDALLYKKNYAEPLRLLGEAYEKTNDSETALRYYNEYLKILPQSPDSRKVRERIAKIKSKLKKESPAAAQG